MNKNRSGKPYESAVARIFQEILDQKAVESLRVERDLRVTGKSATHQIDIAWEFKVGGIVYRTMIQAKDWARPVHQGEVLKFKSVLDDVPGQPRGIMVSQSGFQKGAIEFAQSNGIKLYSMYSPDNNSEPMPVLQLTIRTTGYTRKYESIEPVLDHEWVERMRAGLTDEFRLSISGKPREMDVYDDEMKVVCKFSDLIRLLFPPAPVKIEKNRQEVSFEKPVLIRTTPDSSLPILQMVGIRAEIWTVCNVLDVALEFSPFVSWVLRDILDPSFQYFDSNGKAIRYQNPAARSEDIWVEQEDLPDPQKLDGKVPLSGLFTH